MTHSDALEAWLRSLRDWVAEVERRRLEGQVLARRRIAVLLIALLTIGLCALFVWRIRAG